MISDRRGEMTEHIVVDRERLGELMLFISQKTADDRHFGATKLNKILFFSDFFAYRLLGAPITGAQYQKLEHGPAPVELLEVRQSLIEDAAAVMQEVSFVGYIQKRLIALRDPDISLFKTEQLSLVEEVISALDGQSAGDVSEISHKLSVGWQLAKFQEVIPYATAYLSSRKLTEREHQYILEQLRKVPVSA